MRRDTAPGLAIASLTKSMLHVWLTAKGATRGTRTPMRLVFLRFLIGLRTYKEPHSADDASPTTGTALPGLGVLEKAMNLLNIVSARRTPMTFAELLLACDFPKSTLHRILATLVHEGLLRHNAFDKTVSADPRLTMGPAFNWR